MTDEAVPTGLTADEFESQLTTLIQGIEGMINVAGTDAESMACAFERVADVYIRSAALIRANPAAFAAVVARGRGA